MSSLDDRLRTFHRQSGCDWFDPHETRRCRWFPNVAVTALGGGEGLLAFCPEHAPLMRCPMLSLDTGELIPETSYTGGACPACEISLHQSCYGGDCDCNCVAASGELIPSEVGS